MSLSYLFLPIFVLFSFSQYFSSKISPQLFKIETSIWYTGSQRQVVSWDWKWAFSCLFFPIFVLLSFSPDFSSKISPQPFKIETSNFVYRFTTTSCDFKWAVSYLFFFVIVLFSFSPYFSSKISPQSFKIETSNLVWRIATTSCIVRLQMGILLFILPFICSFFFLSKFFVKDISTTVKDRNFIFGIQVHNHKLYRRIANGPSPICSSFYLFLFLSFQIFRQRYLHNHLRYKLRIWYKGSQRQVISWD